MGRPLHMRVVWLLLFVLGLSISCRTIRASHPMKYRYYLRLARLAVCLSCETSRSAAKTITGTVMESASGAAEDDGDGDFKLKASYRRASERAMIGGAIS